MAEAHQTHPDYPPVTFVDFAPKDDEPCVFVREGGDTIGVLRATGDGDEHEAWRNGNSLGLFDDRLDAALALQKTEEAELAARR